MQRSDCVKYDTCSASLCPLGPTHYIWYPDEEIYKNSDYSKLSWIKHQRKVSKRAKRVDRYFTFAMLNHNCIFRTGVVGLDPDSSVSMKIQERDWITKHKEKRSLSAKEREAVAKRLHPDS